MTVDLQDLFLSILTVISETITALVGMLPNPDPFPQTIADFQQSYVSGGLSDMFPVAYYWLDSFFIADAVITMLIAWFYMFPIAWIILMLWKWLKAR